MYTVLYTVLSRYKRWIDAVSSMFGGLAICSLEAVVAKDGTEVSFLWPSLLFLF